MQKNYRQSRKIRKQQGFSHHILLPVIAIVAVGAIGLYLTFGSKAATGTAPRQASGFIDSLGVIAHLSKEPYNKPNANVPDKLTYLGFKHYRTNAGGSNSVVATINTMAERGVRPSFTIKSPNPKNTTDRAKITAPINEEIDFITENNLASKTDSVENFNELDNPSSAGSKFADVLAVGVPAVWEAAQPLRDDGVKVIAPSLIGFRLEANAPKLGAKISSTNFDYGNIHSYTKGELPEMSYPSADTRQARKAFNVNPAGAKANNLETKLKYYAYHISKEKPIMITELGYHPDYGSDTQRVTSIYLTRSVLETFRVGVKRTYVYQLFDQGTSGNGYGFFQSDEFDFAPKKSAVAMHNLTSLLADSGTTKKLRNLGVVVSGDKSNLRQVLLQKNDGSYWIALWRSQLVYDMGKKKPLHPEPKPLTVTVSGTPRTFTYYTNLAGNDTSKPAPAMQEKGTGSSVTVDVGAEVGLLKLQ